MSKNFLTALTDEANYTYTENGALAYASTGSCCLDLFSVAGALREAPLQDIVARFEWAYLEDPDTAMKILFYARDVRGGLGERRFFKEILTYLCEYHEDSVIKNIDRIAEFGRYDDILVLLDTPCEAAAVDCLKKQLEADMAALQDEKKGISLLAKWLPSVNTSSCATVRLGKKLAKAFGMSEMTYRKTLAALRRRIDILENYLREEDYSFDYEKQPGRAMLKYRKAFYRNDEKRYSKYLDGVLKNKSKMNTGTLMPYEIIRPFYSDDYCTIGKLSKREEKALEATWRAQKDFAGDQNALVVIDGSGSMYFGGNPMPAIVAQSLGLLFAERNSGPFANHFITFSTRPRLIRIKGEHLGDRLRYISSFDEVADTNIQAVFELILNTAVKNRISQKDMPERIFIVSDMEFNSCTEDSSMTNFTYAGKLFERAGYRLPKIVFWNVESRNRQFPVQMNENGVTLVSGCNARLFEQVLSDKTDPYAFMMETIGSERYQNIVA